MKKILFFPGRYVRRLSCWLVIYVAMSALFICCKPKHSDKINETRTEVDGLKVPAGFSIERVAAPELLSYPMFASFDGAGRLFVFESDGSSPTLDEITKTPTYRVRLMEDTNGDGSFDRSKVFADSLSFPKGGVFYKGSLYVTASPDLWRLTDTDGDGVADKREVVLTGWVMYPNGALLGGPFFGPDGWMYITDARRGFDITTKEGKNLKGKSARIWRCLPDGSRLESMAGGGFDNAVELVFMPSGETVGTMTYFIDPQGGMRDALMHWVEGGVYPKPLSVIEEDHLKLTGDLMPVMTKMARVAPAGLMRYRGQAFGKEFYGNLFSAEFNTGRIMRHRVSPQGATYQTLDEPFITSTVPDIHLTDVFEDADGSILVLNTGGWFIAGCPLSRIAKPDVKGGIYRVRKNGSERPDDIWGQKLDLKSLSAEDLTGYLKDARPAVRDNVIERLIEIGEPSVASIRKTLLQSDNAETRAAGVFALYRINTPSSLTEVLAALDDTSALVKTAAARVLGLARNKQSVDKLIELVQHDKPTVRRQAATALGEIGDGRAVAALLNSSKDTGDRFVEHAIIYSLIELKNTAPLVAALTNISPNVRRAALIALDQMDGMPLTKESLVPYLESEDPQLRSIGIWVASHHTDWADIVIHFLEKHLTVGEMSKSEAIQVRDLMITFSENKQLQEFLALQLENAATPVARKALLIDVIGQSPVNEIPAIWIRPLGKELQEADPEIRPLVLGLIESRSIKALNGPLKLIVLNQNLPADFRLKALSSLLLSEPRLSDPQFHWLLKYLDNTNESPIRQLAARTLTRAKLSIRQLLSLADAVAKTDIFLLPTLVSVFERTSNAGVGEALIAALRSSSNRLDNLSEPDLQKLFSKYPESAKASAQPLFATLRERNAGRLSELQAVQAKLKRGDVGQGRMLFYGKAMCSSCHAVGSQGATFAPDLTNIGEIRSSHDILEAILYPSASFAREHETSKVITKTTTYTGIIKEQLPEAIIVATSPGQLVRVQRAEITGIEPYNVSMMPAGLVKLITPDELSDLMAYLVSLPDGMGGHGNEH